MLTQLIIEASHVSLVCAEVGFSHRRPLEVTELSDIVGRYALAREARDEGKEGWLSELRRQLTPPLILEIQAGMQPDAGARTVLQAPWELLADDDGYLAGDALLRFAPARRLGPVQAATTPDGYRLGIAFMAAAPGGGGRTGLRGRGGGDPADGARGRGPVRRGQRRPRRTWVSPERPRGAAARAASVLSWAQRLESKRTVATGPDAGESAGRSTAHRGCGSARCTGFIQAAAADAVGLSERGSGGTGQGRVGGGFAGERVCACRSAGCIGLGRVGSGRGSDTVRTGAIRPFGPAPADSGGRGGGASGFVAGDGSEWRNRRQGRNGECWTG